jgi:hypothetical protein
MILIALAIVSGFYIFFGGGFDFRASEASLLNSKIAECIMNNNIDFSKIGDGFFEICGLNKAVIEENNEIKICVDSQNCIQEDNPVFSINTANIVQCGFIGKSGNFPKCASGIFEKNGRTYTILSVSKQNARKLSG